MNIVIVEDEKLTAEDLKDTILRVAPDLKVVRILGSVKEAVAYFKSNPMPQLIFSDIQLGDGLSFDIYQEVEVSAPIVFCTAYDEYALQAFDTNGIHYILKPFDEKKVEEAIEKFRNLQSVFTEERTSFMKVLESLQKSQGVTQSLLVYQQDKVIPVKFRDIAFFYIKNEVTHLYTFSQKIYYINKSLDVIQQICGDDFYRANRQYIVNRSAIKEINQSLSRKVSVELNVPFQESITISKEKMTDFLDWLKG
ncbi:MAG: LytTR family DNA-binding domain-containing protein [Taibaiella sp.]|nr:LytTR family DNA-binding domain-containing protein [Taibaiella sp.]